jgi:YHS domain-containing protein
MVFIYEYTHNLRMFKDPVCGMMVDEMTAKHVLEMERERVYLCSAACKSQFDASKKMTLQQ